MPDQRQEVEHREEVKEAGHDQHRIAPLDKSLGSALFLTVRVQRVQVM
jgi:hypothetical protein